MILDDLIRTKSLTDNELDVFKLLVQPPVGASQFCNKYKCLETKNVS